MCERRLQQLAQLEAEVARVDCQADLAAYIAAERERPRDAGAGGDGGSSGGGTFGGPPVKYGKALELLDEYHQLRVSNALQEEAEMEFNYFEAVAAGGGAPAGGAGGGGASGEGADLQEEPDL